MNTITHPELVRVLVKPGCAIKDTLTDDGINLWHAATGIAGEGGELLEGVWEERGVDSTRENLLEESGDLYFYIEQLQQGVGITLPWDAIDCVAANREITPDLADEYAVQIAVYSSKVLDVVKKLVIYNKPLDVISLQLYAHRLAEFLGAIGLMFGISRQQALEANIAKLSKRYEGLKYSDGAAQARADKV